MIKLISLLMKLFKLPEEVNEIISH